MTALQRQQQTPSPSATRAPSLAGVEASRGPDGVLSAPASTATASERAIVGAMMEDPRAGPAAAAAGLTPADFADSGLGELYAALQGRLADTLPCDAATILEALPGIVGASALEQCVEAAPATFAHVGYHAEQVKAAVRHRAIRDILARGLARLAAGAESPAMIAAETVAQLAGMDANTGFPRIVKGCDFTATLLPRPPEVISGVLFRGGKMVFGGPSKSYKTWNLIDLAYAVATGSEWLGFQCAQGNALYINLELAEFSTQHRIMEIARARDRRVPDSLRVWNLRGHSAPLDKLLPELLRQIKSEPYSLIVVDPIYKTLAGREENDTGAIGEVCNEIEQVAVKTGAAVAFGSHFAKGNASLKAAIDRISGSGVFARDPDAILTATPHDADGAFTLDLTLRDFAPVEPFVIRWDFPRMHRDTTLDPANLKKPKANTSQYAAALQKLDAAEPGLSLAAASARLGCDRSTVSRLRRFRGGVT